MLSLEVMVQSGYKNNLKIKVLFFEINCFSCLIDSKCLIMKLYVLKIIIIIICNLYY